MCWFLQSLCFALGNPVGKSGIFAKSFYAACFKLAMQSRNETGGILEGIFIDTGGARRGVPFPFDKEELGADVR